MFMPYKSEGDVVLYINLNFYILIRFFFTFYERILLTRIRIQETTEKALEKLIAADPAKYGALESKLEVIVEQRFILVLKALIAI